MFTYEPPTTQLFSCIGLMFATGAIMSAQTQRQPPTPTQRINGLFADLNRRVLDMAKDLPEAKCSHKPSPDVRSFGDANVHIASGNIFAAKAGRGENANWDGGLLQQDAAAVAGRNRARRRALRTTGGLSGNGYGATRITEEPIQVA